MIKKQIIRRLATCDFGNVTIDNGTYPFLILASRINKGEYPYRRATEAWALIGSFRYK